MKGNTPRPGVCIARGVISSQVQRKLHREGRRVRALLSDLRAAAERNHDPRVVACVDSLEQTLNAHLSLVTYVIESLEEDTPRNDDALGTPGRSSTERGT